MRRNPESIARWNQAVREARRAATEHRLPSGAPVLLENIFEMGQGGDVDLAPEGRCPFLGQEAWVSAEGRFSPCCAPDAERRQLGEFGNLAERTVGEVWASEEYRRLQARYQEHALCKGCNMRRPVEGSTGDRAHE